MPKYCTILLLVLVHYHVLAQDRIIKISGEELRARVLEIGLSDIQYRHPDSLQGVIRRIPKTEVFMVQFENGTKEVFESHLPSIQVYDQRSLKPDYLYNLGKEDALKYYSGNGAMWGSAASSMVMFPLGLAGSVAIAATPPKVDARWVSDVNLIGNPDYEKGYREQAHRRKKGKALAGVGIGVGIQLSLIMLLVASAY
ncbi:hypothetical protein H9Q13_04785 [Pontibacter sp. JH31]|uniref:Uncharacterized protein n=1 Tax=Pontibacter aquaedesilientis TaxID=2766980 RepID=A0ABR7XDU5_9BACT|nr:hypothetical protein [Pontibacter aquaedesilientis]MBD1396471.1 hypothetical protein [Pontibacter aquaedesilientis]